MWRRINVVLAIGAVGVLGVFCSASALAGSGNSRSQQHPPNAPPPQPTRQGPTNADAKEAQERGCPGNKVRQIDHEHAHTPQDEPKEPIEFAVHQSSSVLNFGSSRDIRADYIVLKAAREIPVGIFSTDFEIDSLEPMRRIGEASLESVHLRSPTFTPPHFFNHRKEIGFNLCVSGANGDPGTYTGQFQFIGPGAIETATLTQTAQLKAPTGDFRSRFFVVVGLAAFLLFVTNVVQPGWPKNGSEWWARGVIVLVSLGASALAMLIAFSQNPTWGENIWVATAALVTTAFGAAGLGGTLSAAAARINPDPERKAHIPGLGRKGKRKSPSKNPAPPKVKPGPAPKKPENP
jgi:hypothetical protein